MSEQKSFKIQLTTSDGQIFYWHKMGKLHTIPEDLANIWVAKFKPEIFQVTAAGELVAVGRTPEPSFRIVKVEKIAADSPA